jgi:NADPH-dependent curcumin reductase CurA
MAGWIAQGKLKRGRHRCRRRRRFPEVLLRLFRGENMGKLVLEVADK